MRKCLRPWDAPPAPTAVRESGPPVRPRVLAFKYTLHGSHGCIRLHLIRRIYSCNTSSDFMLERRGDMFLRAFCPQPGYYLSVKFIVDSILCSCHVFPTIQERKGAQHSQNIERSIYFQPFTIKYRFAEDNLRRHTCNNVMDPLSWLISYISEPAVTAAILITSDPVRSRDAQMDRTPRSRGGTVACGRDVALWHGDGKREGCELWCTQREGVHSRKPISTSLLHSTFYYRFTWEAFLIAVSRYNTTLSIDEVDPG